MLRGGKRSGSDMSFLGHLENQREELKKAILKAPRHRLDHLATFVETHGERLSHFLEALTNYRLRMRKFRLKHMFIGFWTSLILGAGVTGALMISGVLGGMNPQILFGVAGGIALMFFLCWTTLLMKRRAKRYHSRMLKDLDKLTHLENQTRRDSWDSVKNFVFNYLEKTRGRFSLSKTKTDYAAVKLVRDKGSTEIREALNELAGLKDDDIFIMDQTELSETSSPSNTAGKSVK
jgi:EH domain-containing protein 1